MATAERLMLPKAADKSAFASHLLTVLPKGINTVAKIMDYYPFAELRMYCNRYERPYNMVTYVLRALRKEGKVEYDNRIWKLK